MLYIQKKNCARTNIFIIHYNILHLDLPLLPPHPHSIHPLHLSLSSYFFLVFSILITSNFWFDFLCCLTSAAVLFHISLSFFAKSPMDKLRCSPLIFGWYSEHNKKTEGGLLEALGSLNFFMVSPLEECWFSFLFHNKSCQPLPCL